MTEVPRVMHFSVIIFSAVVDALEWVVRQRGIEDIFHYIDDFVAVGPSTEDCGFGQQTLIQTCDNLGVCIAHDKTVGPTTRLTVLGTEIDMVAMTLCLMHEKLERLLRLVATW